MKSWDNLKHGDKVKNVENGEVFEVYIWRGEKYLARGEFKATADAYDNRF